MESVDLMIFDSVPLVTPAFAAITMAAWPETHGVENEVPLPIP